MPPITAISSVPPDFTRPEPRVRDRQRLATGLLDQVQRALGSRILPAPLSAAELAGAATPPQLQAAREQQPRLRPPLDLVQRYFLERRAALREAALQRDEILQQQANDQLRPIVQAQREADRLQVLRDAQLLETQRLAAQRFELPTGTERLQAQRLQEPKLTERALARDEPARREAQRLQEEQAQERIEERRLEEERIREQQEAERVEAERVERQREASRSDRVDAQQAEVEARAPTESERAAAERALLAYRSESQRALADADAARAAAQPLNEQLRVARERLDALDALRIDRVDVSSVSLSRLA